MEQRNNRDLERLLAKGVEQVMPDLCDAAAHTPLPSAARCTQLLPQEPPDRRRVRPLRRVLAACLLVVLISGGLAGYFHPAASIGIDVNPSIALTTNLFDRVLTAEANNADAETVLGGLKLRGVDLDTAVSAIIGSMVQHGYLSGGGAAVHITVTAGSEQRVVRLEQRVSEDIRNALSAESGGVAVYTGPAVPKQEEAAPPEDSAPVQTPAPPAEPAPAGKPQAEPGGASEAEPEETPDREPDENPDNGKKAWIDYLLTLDPTLDVQQLQRMRVKDLKELAEDLEDAADDDAEDGDDPDDDEDDDHGRDDPDDDEDDDDEDD